MKLQAEHQIEEINIDSPHSSQQLQAEHEQFPANTHFVKMTDHTYLNILWILLILGCFGHCFGGQGRLIFLFRSPKGFDT